MSSRFHASRCRITNSVFKTFWYFQHIFKAFSEIYFLVEQYAQSKHRPLIYQNNLQTNHGKKNECGGTTASMRLLAFAGKEISVWWETLVELEVDRCKSSLLYFTHPEGPPQLKMEGARWCIPPPPTPSSPKKFTWYLFNYLYELRTKRKFTSERKKTSNISKIVVQTSLIFNGMGCCTFKGAASENSKDLRRIQGTVGSDVLTGLFSSFCVTTHVCWRCNFAANRRDGHNVCVKDQFVLMHPK